jgi:glycosyltransferase involved in cell wall biosynthesis
MLKALPEIVKADPSVLYIVMGAIHPEVLRCEGKSYKFELEEIVRDLGLDKNVVFHNRFVEDQELFEILGATDIYVTPYLHKEQLTSGTLAFAVGTGKAVVSTPYWAAQELLAHGRGQLVRFGDSKHIARSIVKLLSNNSLFYKMRKRAYEYGRSMIWPKVGQSYWKLLNSPAHPQPIPLKQNTGLPDWKMLTCGPEQIYRTA